MISRRLKFLHWFSEESRDHAGLIHWMATESRLCLCPGSWLNFTSMLLKFKIASLYCMEQYQELCLRAV